MVLPDSSLEKGLLPTLVGNLGQRVEAAGEGPAEAEGLFGPDQVCWMRVRDLLPTGEDQRNESKPATG